MMHRQAGAAVTHLAPLGGSQILTSWRFDIPAFVAVVLLGAAYLYGVWRLRRRGEPWGWWPTFAFVGLGLGSIVLVTMSCLGVYDRVLFWPRAVQYLTLIGLSPALLAAGEPLQLARRCLSDQGRRRLDRALRSGPVRVVSFPLVGAVLGATFVLAIYLSPLYRLTLTSELAHHLVWLGLLLAGAVFFVPELDPGTNLLPEWCGYGFRVLFALIDGLLDAVPGIVVMTLQGTIAASYYQALHRGWGPPLHWDQTIGGALMLTVGEVIALPSLALVMTRWVREDERRARETDRRLDQIAIAEAAAAGEAAPGSVDEVPLLTRPWWETDPRWLGRQGRFR